MTELWQLYDESGQPITGKGATKSDVYAGALHGAAHMWIWRLKTGVLEILLQKRAADKRTWPDFWDISAAGHIDLGEDPLTAAVREIKEEIGLNVRKEDLVFISKRRDLLNAPSGAVENEFRWVYALRLNDDHEVDFVFGDKEVEELIWKPLSVVREELISPDKYVPQGEAYFTEVFDALENLARE